MNRLFLNFATHLIHHKVLNSADETFSNRTVPDSDTIQMLCLFVQMGVQNPESLIED